jgi:hypothetical protein
MNNSFKLQRISAYNCPANINLKLYYLLAVWCGGGFWWWPCGGGGGMMFGGPQSTAQGYNKPNILLTCCTL